VVEEPTAASIAEGATRSLSSHLTFDTPGIYRFHVVAALGTFAGISITKQLPPAQQPVPSLTVLANPGIRSVADYECQITNLVGSVTTFAQDFSDAEMEMLSGQSYQWTVTGATIQGGATSAQVRVKMPDQPGATVAITLRVSLPNGAVLTDTESFTTISGQAAGLQQMMCEISHLIARSPLKPDGPDPGPDRTVQINPSDIAAIHDAATNIVTAAISALKANEVVTPAPGVRSMPAAKMAAHTADVSVSTVD
jgi:hypothetical protein